MQKQIRWRALALAVALIMACGTAMAYQDPYDGSFSYTRAVRAWVQSLQGVQADVVFYGDSITYNGKWQQYFPANSVMNLDVSGDLIESLVVRMPLLHAVQPGKCFVMIGMNDLNYYGDVEKSLADFDVLAQLLLRLQQEQGTRIYVQSVLPVNENITVFQVSNQQIRQFNAGLKQLAQAYGFTYIDVHSALMDEYGMLDSSYTIDGLHLRPNAYDVWTRVIAPYVEE